MAGRTFALAAFATGAASATTSGVTGTVTGASSTTLNPGQAKKLGN